MIKARGGFTLVELMITMVIMVILTTLAVVITGNIQVQARDNEREQDMQAIARGLEQYYNIGNSKVTGFTTKGTYPGVNEALHVDGWSRSPGYTPEQVPGGYRTVAYPGTTEKSFLNPGGKGAWSIVCVYACQPNTSITPAQTTKEREIELVQLMFADPDNAGKYLDKYVYVPLTSDGYVCSAACARYNLYWIKETDTTPLYTIPGLSILKSKHQQ